MLRFSGILMALAMAVVAAAPASLTADILPAANDAVFLRFDAGEITGLEDYTLLPTWSDLSGNGYHLGQTDTTKQPRYRSEEGQTWDFNNKPVVMFNPLADGVADYMLTNAFSSPLTQADHIFVVAADAYPGNNSELFTSNVADNRQFLQLFGTTSTANAGSNLPLSTFASTAPTVHEVLFNGSSSYWNVNGDLQSSGDAGTQGLGNLVVGCRSNLTSRFLNGRVAEIIVFDHALNTWERNQIGHYLDVKYGIGTSYTPEPGALVLLSTGLIGLLAYAWRKRR
jgi:hypothetical protein